MSSEHRKGKRRSTRAKHQEGLARKTRDQGGEKADDEVRRFPPRRPPPDYKGPWPPKSE